MSIDVTISAGETCSECKREMIAVVRMDNGEGAWALYCSDCIQEAAQAFEAFRRTWAQAASQNPPQK